VLLNTYREISKDLITEPIISGGVTYSKAMANCVAFGPMREGDRILAHQANESLDIQNLDKLFEIYTETMIRLGNA
jgi:succinyl-diaminopimelate desuccinylase